MSLPIQLNYINSNSLNTIKTYNENGATLPVEGIEELYELSKTAYTASSILQWRIPVNTKAMAIHINENDDISANNLIFGVTDELGSIIWTYTLLGSDFDRKGSVWTWKIPDLILHQNWIFGLLTTVNLERIQVTCKRIALLPEILPL